eukprot:CAMPEP_0113508904 /NCGR_PEP_ID=MMETSP0014_2-20120614/37272_1 /TAXON_ID=2857 /ORGANISM="Nitzschia sp." /LENGTH=671 /DNA_ID=CAMNT_0000404661 /DNA_START=416 /DNA_END=2431 /DNA_ORIENTATION=- /assembly_acc=CAM_ASM_000159
MPNAVQDTINIYHASCFAVTFVHTLLRISNNPRHTEVKTKFNAWWANRKKKQTKNESNRRVNEEEVNEELVAIHQLPSDDGNTAAPTRNRTEHKQGTALLYSLQPSSPVAAAAMSPLLSPTGSTPSPTGTSPTGTSPTFFSMSSDRLGVVGPSADTPLTDTNAVGLALSSMNWDNSEAQSSVEPPRNVRMNQSKTAPEPLMETDATRDDDPSALGGDEKARSDTLVVDNTMNSPRQDIVMNDEVNDLGEESDLGEDDQEGPGYAMADNRKIHFGSTGTSPQCLSVDSTSAESSKNIDDTMDIDFPTPDDNDNDNDNDNDDENFVSDEPHPSSFGRAQEDPEGVRRESVMKSSGTESKDKDPMSPRKIAATPSNTSTSTSDATGSGACPAELTKQQVREAVQAAQITQCAEEDEVSLGGAYFISVKQLASIYDIHKSVSGKRLRDCFPSVVKTLCSSVRHTHHGAKVISDMLRNKWFQLVQGDDWKRIMTKSSSDINVAQMNHVLQPFSLMLTQLKPKYHRNPANLFQLPCGQFVMFLDLKATRKNDGKVLCNDKHALAFIVADGEEGGTVKLLIDCANGRKPIVLEESDYTDTFVGGKIVKHARENAIRCISEYLTTDSTFKVTIRMNQVYCLDDPNREYPPFEEWESLGLHKIARNWQPKGTKRCHEAQS